MSNISELSWLEIEYHLIAMAIRLKHTLDAASAEDGARVLVDQRRPRGVDVDTLELQAWLPELSPSVELQRSLVEKPRQWMLFRRRYLAELRDQKAADALKDLHTITQREAVTTLLTSAKDPERSHAAILRDLMDGLKKPPSTTGPVREIGAERMRARRNR